MIGMVRWANPTRIVRELAMPTKQCPQETPPTPLIATVHGRNQSQRRESNPQPPHYECGALPIEATLAKGLTLNRTGLGSGENLPPNQGPPIGPSYQNTNFPVSGQA